MCPATIEVGLLRTSQLRGPTQAYLGCSCGWARIQSSNPNIATQHFKCLEASLPTMLTMGEPSTPQDSKEMNRVLCAGLAREARSVG